MKNAQEEAGIRPQEILDTIVLVSSEKQLESEIVFQALEGALAAATKRKIGEETDVVVAIDRQTGEYATQRRWTVMEDAPEEEEEPEEEEKPMAGRADAYEEPEEKYFVSEERHLTLPMAKKKDKNAALGQQFYAPMANIAFGRIAAQSARQVMFGMLRKAERDRMAKDYRNRIGELISGQVKRITSNKEKAIIELEFSSEAILPRRLQLETDELHINTSVQAVLHEIEETTRGPQLVLSRVGAEMVEGLFRREVPELVEQVVEIKAIAREAGICTKLAVASKDARIDPVGACVGIGGVRVKQVMQELGGERIDVFYWDDDLIKLAMHAMAPAEPNKVTINEHNRTLDFVVPDEQLARAIGRNGQNVRLASKLIGWAINILSEQEAVEQQETQQEQHRSELATSLNLSEPIANRLVAAGMNSVEDIFMAEDDALLAIEGIDQKNLAQIQELASDILLREAVLSVDEQVGTLDEELMSLQGMNPDLAYTLAQAGLSSRALLSEKSVDDVLELVPDLDETLAADLIMTARQPLLQSLSEARLAEEQAAEQAAGQAAEPAAGQAEEPAAEPAGAQTEVKS